MVLPSRSMSERPNPFNSGAIEKDEDEVNLFLFVAAVTDLPANTRVPLYAQQIEPQFTIPQLTLPYDSFQHFLIDQDQLCSVSAGTTVQPELGGKLE